MAKFNVKGVKPPVAQTPIITTGTPVVNARGGEGFRRDPKSKLFILGISNFVGEKTFHEKATQRDARFEALVSQVAVADPAWMAGFLPWLRDSANMRSASLTGALIATKAMIDAKVPGGRQLIASVLARADEPGEALAFWVSRFGKKLPMPVKRGIADAARQLYNEAAVAKYDTAAAAFRFADVVQLTHTKPGAPWQDLLFKYTLDRRYNRQAEVPTALSKLTANRQANATLAEGGELSADQIKAAGLTWQNTISAATDKKAAWEAQIPTMGYMALLRNLRNFDDAGIDQAVADQVIARLIDPQEVVRSKQFPYRFLSAYKELQGLRWATALDRAITLSLANIPELPGDTLIVVDRSGSMFGRGLSEHSKSDWAEVAGVYGAGLAIRNAGRSTLIQYGSTAYEIPVRANSSVLQVVGRMHNLGGTNTVNTINATFKGHDRIVVITDEQTEGSFRMLTVPATVPIYTFNLAGYSAAQFDSGSNKVTIGGGLTDAAFKLIPLLEAGSDARWPWEEEPASV